MDTRVSPRMTLGWPIKAAARSVFTALKLPAELPFPPIMAIGGWEASLRGARRATKQSRLEEHDRHEIASLRSQ